MPPTQHDNDVETPVSSDGRPTRRAGGDAPSSARRTGDDAPPSPPDDADLQSVIDHYERLLEGRRREADDRHSPRRQDRGPLDRLAQWLRDG